MKQDVRKLTFDKLKDYVLETGLPAFRAKQIWEWIWVKSAHTFDEMSNLSLLMRAQLAKDFDILPISVQTDRILKSPNTEILACLYLLDIDITDSNSSQMCLFSSCIGIYGW